MNPLGCLLPREGRGRLSVVGVRARGTDGRLSKLPIIVLGDLFSVRDVRVKED